MAPSAGERLAAARAYLQAHAHDEVLVVGASRASADELVLDLARARGALVGVSRVSFAELATKLALPVLAERLVSPGGALGVEAMVTRAAFDALDADELTYFGPVADLPGFPRALARTLSELQSAGVAATSLAAVPHVGPDLAALLTRVDEEARRAGSVNRASTLTTAAERVRTRPEALGARHVLLLDVAIATNVEQALVAAVVDAAATTFATTPEGDAATLAAYVACGAEMHRTRRASRGPARARPAADLAVCVRGAAARRPRRRRCTCCPLLGKAARPSRSCAACSHEAAAGVPFDEMAVLLRAPHTYLGLLEHAFARAGVPAWFERGTRRPDPAGRAFLALLACADEGLSARRFAEYLSLGQVPPNVTGPVTGHLPRTPQAATFAGSANEVAEALIPPAERVEDPAPLDEAPAATERDGDRVVAGHAARALAVGGAARRGLRDRGPGALAATPARVCAASTDRRVRELADEDQDAPRLRALERDREQLATPRVVCPADRDGARRLARRAHLGRVASRLLGAAAARAAPAGARGARARRDGAARHGRPGRAARGARRAGAAPAHPDAASRRAAVTAACSSARRTPRAAARSASCSCPGWPSASSRSACARTRCCSTRAAPPWTPALATADTRADDERLLLRLAVGAATDARLSVVSAPRAGRVAAARAVVLRARRDARDDRRDPALRDARRRRRSRAAARRSTGRRRRDPAAAIDDMEHDLAVLLPLLRAPAAAAAGHEGRARYLLELNARAAPVGHRALVALAVAAGRTADGLIARAAAHRAGARGAAAHGAPLLAVGAAALRRVPVPVPARGDLPAGAARRDRRRCSGSIR